MKATLSKAAFAALLGASAIALTTTGASARIVCNEAGDCWHVHADYVYRPDFGLVVHPDNWTWKEGGHHRWREHEGKGFWRGDKWTDF